MRDRIAEWRRVRDRLNAAAAALASGVGWRSSRLALRAPGIAISVVLMASSLGACASRPGPDVLDAVVTPALPAGAHVSTLYVATTRERAAPDQNVFTDARSPALNFASFRISVPPDHRPGAIEWAKSTPDPKTDFATVGHASLDRRRFQQEVVRAQAPSKREVIVFVHGFNNSFQEALFRLAQIMADAKQQAVPVLFS